MAAIVQQHEWNLSPEEAIALQRRMKEQVVLKRLEKPVRLVAGTDISYNKHSDEFYTGIVVLDFNTMAVVSQSNAKSRAPFPYIPGLLSFREIPSLLIAWENLEVQPDLVICDGQGIAHPRRLGIASHFGILTGTPSIGCAKTLLTGKYEAPERQRGGFSPLTDKGEVIGYALCTKNKVNPVFVSPGHLITLEESREMVLACGRGYRLPEPTRQAHLLVNRLRTKGV